MHLSSYAEDGFRTLAFAYRLLDVSEYENWNKIFTQANLTIGPERCELLEDASEMIEKNLTLLGVAAIEDKLQKGVNLFLSLTSCASEYLDIIQLRKCIFFDLSWELFGKQRVVL